MKKIIVTGGVGFVGTNLIKRLLSEGHEVHSIDNYSTGNKENEQEGCTYHDLDINDEELLRMHNWPLKNVDVIFHIAALARIQPSLIRPQETIEANVNGTLSILEFARKDNIPVIFSGSSSFHHGLYGSAYAWSKHAGEQLCKLYSEVYGLNTSICRFYNVYGPHQLEEGEYATVLGIFEKQIRNKLNLTITGTGEQRRDFTHIDDIVDGLYRCMDKDFKAEIFELGRGVNHSINEIVDMYGVERKYIPARKGEYPTTLCTDTKAHEMLGWSPTKNLEDYIKGKL
jgi:nucleoside-diphosphate-sugar epimerase|tara:strand:+ start:10730 stop:11584 length:855 start_codon:yes stop_codon:yes gene_type:complete